MTSKNDTQKAKPKIKSAIKRACEYGDGLFAPYGETPDALICCPANNYVGQWQHRFDWMFNGTRYDVLYASRLVEPCDDDDGQRFILVHLNGFGREFAMAFEFTTNTYVHYSWVMKKMDVNEADAVGLCRLLERLGHSVGYPRPMPVIDCPIGFNG